MVVTVLVTEEEAAVVVEEEAAAARVAEAKSASGRGGGSALAARRWRKRPWRAFAMLAKMTGPHRHFADRPQASKLEKEYLIRRKTQVSGGA